MEHPHLRILIPALALTLMAPNTFAQSIVTGAISGAVLDELGRPMPDVHVVLAETGAGVQRERQTGDRGQFDFLFLPPGSYEIFAQQLGYRANRVRGIPVGPGRATRVPISLALAPPPVTVYMSMSSSVVPLSWWGPLARVCFPTWRSDACPAEVESFAELARFSSVSHGGLAIEGLPGRQAGVLVDGVPYAGAVHHPALSDSGYTTALLPYSQLASAELLPGGVDIE